MLFRKSDFFRDDYLVLLWYIYSESWGYFFTLETNSAIINIGYYYLRII